MLIRGHVLDATISWNSHLKEKWEMGPEKLSNIFWNGHMQTHMLLRAKKSAYSIFLLTLFLCYCCPILLNLAILLLDVFKT